MLKKKKDQVVSASEQDFWDFTKFVPVASRDTGFGPIDPWGTQRELVRQIFDGLNQGVRQFYVLKAGQVGASTIMQLLTAYWFLKMSPGMQGVTVTDSDELREFFRDNFCTMLESLDEQSELEEDIEKKTNVRKNNKNMVAFKNGGRLMWQVSGTRTGSRLGVGRGVAFVHGSEVPLWSNPNSLTYLRTRFSDKHPHRLLVLEGTARGKNWWFDLWREGGEAADIKRIFLGWWLREDYSLDPKSSQFEKYWDGKLNSMESRWARDLKRFYDVVLTAEQWAYKRWYTAEKAGGSQRLSDQEMPTVPSDAFEATGSSFLGYELTRQVQKSLTVGPTYKPYRYEFGQTVEDSNLINTTHQLAELRVWKEPEDFQAYVISAVPSYSATSCCATAVVSVWRAERDTLEQVAEYASDQVGLQTFSWVCLHLLGLYKVQRRAFILEVQGHGMGVLQELQRFQQSGWGIRPQNMIRTKTVIGPIRHYLWNRPDSMTGSFALQHKTDSTVHSWMIRRLKDQLERGTLVIRSKDLFEECERMRQLDDTFASESSNPEEHRLMAAALAVESWIKQLRPLFKSVQGPAEGVNVMTRMLQNVFGSLGGRA